MKSYTKYTKKLQTLNTSKTDERNVGPQKINSNTALATDRT